MDAGAAIGVRLASPVAHQAAGVDHLTLCMERGNGVPVLQRGELPTSVEKDWATAHEERAGAPLNDRREGGIELAFTCYFHGQDLPSDGATCRLDVAQFDFSRLLAAPSVATMAALGTSSFSSPNCLAPKSVVVKTAPVMLPPGRLRLATKPVLTGSNPVVKTMGIAAVAALTAGMATPFATITATGRRTNSAAIPGSRSF